MPSPSQYRMSAHVTAPVRPAPGQVLDFHIWAALPDGRAAVMDGCLDVLVGTASGTLTVTQSGTDLYDLVGPGADFEDAPGASLHLHLNEDSFWLDFGTVAELKKRGAPPCPPPEG